MMLDERSVQPEASRETNEIPRPERPKEVAHDESPSLITNHAFEPRAEWFTLCIYCSLAESAHAKTTQTGREHLRYYSDDNPDD